GDTSSRGPPVSSNERPGFGGSTLLFLGRRCGRNRRALLARRGLGLGALDVLQRRRGLDLDARLGRLRTAALHAGGCAVAVEDPELHAAVLLMRVGGFAFHERTVEAVALRQQAVRFDAAGRERLDDRVDPSLGERAVVLVRALL